MRQFIQILLIFLFFPVLGVGQELIFDYHPKQVRKEIHKLAKQIGKENEIHDDAIGFGGVKTKQYDRFEALVELANIEELLHLMKHSKPAVRAYSFWALAKRDYEDLEVVFFAHANDEEWVYQIQGCIGGNIPVNDFLSWVVTPGRWDLNCKKLTRQTVRNKKK